MSRFLPLVVFALWMSGPGTPLPSMLPHGWATAIFLTIYLLLVLAMRVWSNRVAAEADVSQVQTQLRQFNRMMFFARLLVPGWFAFGVFIFGWKLLVFNLLGRSEAGTVSVEMPGLIVGTLPALLTWMGLWWAQYPADQSLRIQNLFIELNGNEPIHAPPSFRNYFAVNVRMELMFAVAPALALILLRDFAIEVLWSTGWLRNNLGLFDLAVTVPSMAILLIFGPELLRRVISTEPIPDGPLRQRLEEMCKKNRIGFQDLLIWKTKSQMGNAAVMGFLAPVRYFLITDVLLETMDQRQIEAVFAHEIGHIVHRHLYWLGLTVGILALTSSGPGDWLGAQTDALMSRIGISESWQWIPEFLGIGAAIGLFALVFGFVSRRLERQADVFAARSMQEDYDRWADRQGHWIAPAVLAAPIWMNDLGGPLALSQVLSPTADSERPSYVGREGAHIFCSALRRVAAVNSIPIAARSWCHGSIGSRIQFVLDLSPNASATFRYDRFMRRMYAILLFCVCVLGGWAIVTMQNG